MRCALIFLFPPIVTIEGGSRNTKLDPRKCIKVSGNDNTLSQTFVECVTWCYYLKYLLGKLIHGCCTGF